MSPEEKRWLVLTSAAFFIVFLFFFALSYIPVYLYLLFFFVGCCCVCYYKAEEFRLFDRLGLNPRRGLRVPPASLRCLPGETLREDPIGARNRNRANKSDARDSLATSVERHFGSFAQRKEAAFSDPVFSPRDLLMGSYLSRTESPSSPGRPSGGSGIHLRPGEQLRERLVRPNHGIPSPNRRLSFGDPVGTMGRFTITPQRHYPLQRTGTSSVGVLPPAQWDGFCKKNVLTRRNTSVHSPVTVKIARPDNTTRSSLFDQPNPPGALPSPGFGVQADPCSRETVLNVLRESRKRDVDDEDKGHSSGQKSKRRRHDSSGSSQSAFEPLLANGALSQLVPKPGSLKRGMNSSVLEESTTKRSRTSSISSMSGVPPSYGVPGSVRNAIHSSYSSSKGYSQRRVASSISMSPLTSPGSSRCQTPERAAKKPREDDATSPNSLSSLLCDKTANDLASSSGTHSPAPEAKVTSVSDSGGSSGKRKRKIQLVSMRRGDQISMPPPPELGYTITVKDLDMEKRAILSQIQKVLEEPEPELPAPAPVLDPSPAPTSNLTPTSAPTPSSSVGLFSQLAPAFSTTVTPALSAPSLVSPSTSSSGPVLATKVSTPVPAPTIDLTVTPANTVSAALTQITTTTISSITSVAPAPSVTNPLLESLKNMKNNTLLSATSPLAATSAAPVVSVVTQAPISIASAGLENGAVKSEPSLVAPQPTASVPATKPATSMQSAFAQILAQPLQSSSSTFSPAGSSLFSVTPAANLASVAPTFIKSTTVTVPAVATSSVANPTISGFKPIFGAATTAPASATEVKPTQPTFKPIFGSAARSGLGAFGQPATSVSSAPAQGSTSLFGDLTNTQPAPVSVASSTPATQTPSQSLFGSWGSASAAPAAPAPVVNSTFQFAASSSTPATSGLGTSTTTSSSTTTFQFGALKPAQTAPAAPQNTFTQNTFGQTTAAQNSTATTFGRFGMASNTATTAANAPTTQATFGSSVFSTSMSFPSAGTQAPAAAKPFTFGASNGGSASTPFTFGTPASTAAPTFGTSNQPTFGSTSTGFSFGNTTTQSVAPAFGATTQTAAQVPAPAFTFGAVPATPQNSVQSAQPPAASGGFNFTASLSGAQFGTPTPAAQNPGFTFGNSNADNKPTFGTSTPVFGSTGGPIPFGSPGTPAQGFSASPFATPSATFSIGAGSKPSGTRQRLQARRQHVRKK